MLLSEPDMKAMLHWLAFGQTGASSLEIARICIDPNYQQSMGDYPLDIWDFMRCNILLGRVPSARAGVEKLAQQSLVWRQFHLDWERIVLCLNTKGTKKANDIVRTTVIAGRAAADEAKREYQA